MFFTFLFFCLSAAVSGSVVGVCGCCAVCVSGGLWCHQSAAAEGSGVGSESRVTAATAQQGKTHTFSVSNTQLNIIYDWSKFFILSILKGLQSFLAWFACT